MMAKDLVAVERRALTPTQFGDLADVPPELEWLANITNPKTRRAYSILVAALLSGSLAFGAAGTATFRRRKFIHTICRRP
jgi:hypothetical protein